jgi:hypothetical protein
MRLVVLENERLRVAVLAGKGSDVVAFNDTPRDLDFAWLSAGGVRVTTSYLPTSPDPLATFVDTYRDGWQDVFPSGGVSSTYQRAHVGQHGEVSSL